MSTFFISDRRMAEHKCEWDPDHIERPERLSAILDALQNEGILDQCTQLESAECSLEDLMLVHTSEYVESIRRSASISDISELERWCAEHEDIFVNGASWQCALLSAGCALKAMEAVLEEANIAKRMEGTAGRRRAPNAFAAIRPPGHHASRDTPCGFCLFNNVAICARKARTQFGVERVLILDWDVHAGQGTQYCVKDDPDGTLLISAHRYERGEFWPELLESAVVHNYPNTINVPLNSTGLGDAEYAALMHFLVLPVIHQWKPQLILVSCGFDAAVGDPQGEMCLSPAGFGYMTGLLTQLDIPLCLLLEGGYFIPSMVQGAVQCVLALLQKAPPLRNFCHSVPSSGFLRTLFANQLVYSAKWPLFANWIRLLNELRASRKCQPIEIPKGEYIGHRHLPSLYPTRGNYPPRAPEVEKAFERQLQLLLEQNGKRQKRESLELEVDLASDAHLLALKSESVSESFPMHGRDHFLLIYFFVLLPLNFQFFDIRLPSGATLPLLNTELADQFEDFKSTKNEGTEAQLSVLKQFIIAFPQLHEYLLF